MVPDFPNLSPSDVKYLEAAILKYGKMEFGQLKALSHREPAYVEAEQQFGLNNEMNLARWIEELPQDSSTMLEQLVSANARIKFYAA
jgi:hypothetical protein